MDLQEPEKMECRLTVNLPSNTPVVGCEINPFVRVLTSEGSLEVPPHSLSFRWYRERITCSVHHSRLATLQCLSCVTLKIPVEESYHCSANCFLAAWKNHVVRHSYAAETVSETSNGDCEALSKLRSCGSWPSLSDEPLHDERSEIEIAVEKEGKLWTKVGSSKTYVPSMTDCGFSLRLECLAINSSMGTQLSLINITVTGPVIISPPSPCRCMIQIEYPQKSSNFNAKAKSNNDLTFSVLSYNILSDLYASRDMYSYCPTWALAWEYRRKKLLHEIIVYDADIICLQEVQSDHFENFFKPELTERGYSVMYKKKTKEVYTANKFIIDGCATFYRRELFKEIDKYELEFDKIALPVVEALEPGLKSQGSIRLLKDNVALVVILETVKNYCSGYNAFKTRICVANTHIHANSKLPDVQLFQVANLVSGLDKIAQSQIPLLICGDLNSLPASDPHNFLVSGSIDPHCEKKKTDPLGIYQHLKLRHSMSLVSAYASLYQSERVGEQQMRKMDPQTREPLFTNFKSGFSGTLDYIFYTANSLRVEGLLELLDSESLGEGLPSALWSSDHIALMASFRHSPPPWQRLGPPLPSNLWEQAAIG